MSFPLSAVSSIPLSAIANTLDLKYINSNRLLMETSAMSSLNGIPIILFDVLSDIKDVSMNNDTLIFLTSNAPLSSTVSTYKDVSGTIIGYKEESKFTRYFYGNDDYNQNFTIDPASNTNVKNNKLIISSFKDNDNYYVLPLKSSYGTTDEYDFNKVKTTQVARDYNAIYFGNNQENGYDNVYLQYTATNIPVSFYSDKFTPCYIPDKIIKFTPNAGGFNNNGAHAGNRPLNSDVIIIDKENYGKYTNNGFAKNSFNGTPLCLWLSGASTNTDASMNWMERWYDPNIISQGSALIAAVNTNSAFCPVVDIPSTSYLCAKDKFTYLRFGPNRNITAIQDISSSLFCNFSQWDNKFTDNVNDIAGFMIGNYPTGSFNVFNLDGTVHGHIPPTDVLFNQKNFTFNTWIYQDSWACGIDTQYFGNFTDGEGYGLFFNTSANPELITFPTTSGDVFAFNNRGYKLFEKSINQSLGVSASSVDYITTDAFGARWIYDDTNKQIYKLDTDDLLTEVIALSPTAKIVKMEFNANNELYVLNATNKTISGFDTHGVLSFGPSTSLGYNNFVIDGNNGLYLQNADILQVSNTNNYIKALGVNLYKNNNLFYHVGKKILAMNIDSNDNIWVLYTGNNLIQISSTGVLLQQVKLDLPFNNTKTASMSFIKDIQDGCDYDVIWIVFNDNNYVIKVNSSGKIIKRIDVNKVVNRKKCGDFILNVKGDFTGFDVKRKFSKFADGSIISSINPAISLKINLKCGSTNTTQYLHTPAKKLRGWNNISFTYEIKNTSTILRLFINGTEAISKVLNGLYTINWGTKVTPFIIGGHSGKLGAINVERALNNKDYFIGKIDDVRLYNRALDNFEIRSLANNRHYDGWEDMIWYMPTPQRTFMEEITQFHMNRYHGHKSNKFNIRIKNLDIVDGNVQDTISSSVHAAMAKLIPVNTELNDIIFD